jgi:hypothetical protein
MCSQKDRAAALIYQSVRRSNAGFRPFCVLMDPVGALSRQGLIPPADSTQSKLALVEPTFLLLFD